MATARQSAERAGARDREEEQWLNTVQVKIDRSPSSVRTASGQLPASFEPAFERRSVGFQPAFERRSVSF